MRASSQREINGPMPYPPSLVNKDPPGQVTLQGKLCSEPAMVALRITSHKLNAKEPRPSSGRRRLAFQAGIVQVPAPSWIKNDITAVGGRSPSWPKAETRTVHRISATSDMRNTDE